LLVGSFSPGGPPPSFCRIFLSALMLPESACVFVSTVCWGSSPLLWAYRCTVLGTCCTTTQALDQLAFRLPGLLGKPVGAVRYRFCVVIGIHPVPLRKSRGQIFLFCTTTYANRVPVFVLGPADKGREEKRLCVFICPLLLCRGRGLID